MKTVVLMFQFLTKLPLPFKINANSEDFQKGIVYFPLVGLVIGGLLWGGYQIGHVFFPYYIAVFLTLAFHVFITGGLHLDGLADTFDGLYSYRKKAEMLEIMKDSRVGTNGVLVLIIALLLKGGLLLGLATESILWPFLLMPVYGRMMGVFLAHIGVYARPEGMGGFFIGHTKKIHVLMALTITVLASLIHIKALLILPVMVILTYVYNHHVKAKIDGITGDVLGAWIEISEIIFLMGVYLL